MQHLSKNANSLQALETARLAGKKRVFTNGCFDLLHVGHLRYLEQARSLGDLLVVAVNSDESVKRLKGPDRPILPVNERIELLSALKPVDFVLEFEEDTPLELIKLIRPEVLVKGGDWPVEKIVGSQVVTDNGGTVRSLPFVEGRSTTSLLDKIRSSES